MSRRGRMPPAFLVRDYETLFYALKLTREKERLSVYVTDDGMSVGVWWASQNGYKMLGGPGNLRGWIDPELGYVCHVDSLSNDDIEHIQDATRTLAAIRRHIHPKAMTAGSAVVKLFEEREGRSSLNGEWIRGEDGLEAVMLDSIHAGPSEWRRALNCEEVVYLDQVGAHMQSIWQGLPTTDWRRIKDQAQMNTVLSKEWSARSYCTVVDATWDLGAACLPRKVGPFGPVVYETGRVRTTVRGPLAINAIIQGNSVVTFHGGYYTERRIPQYFCRHLQNLIENGGVMGKRAAKAAYQRLHGKLMAKSFTTGRVTDESGYRSRSVEVDHLGNRHVVSWFEESSDSDYQHFRPDIAGEIVASTHARTLALAAKWPSASLLHVDAVLGLREDAPNVDDLRGRWSKKGQGWGSVYGHGRYIIKDPETGEEWCGRMGMAEGEEYRMSSPRDELNISARIWNGMESKPYNATGAQQWQSAMYPWDNS